MIIVLSGYDGSGKTTLARELVAELIRNGQKAEYVHGYEFSFIHGILRRFRKRIESGELTREHDRKGSKRWYMRIWPYCLCLDFSFKLFIYKYLFIRKIYVFDRYIYDYLLSCYYQGYKLPLTLMLATVPSPSYGFWLKPSLDFSLKNRAAEHNRKYFEEIAALYDRHLPSNMSLVETGRDSVSEDLEKILAKIDFK